MGIVSNLQSEKVEVPHESGQWFEFKPISHTKMEAARSARRARALSIFDGLSDGAIKAMQSGESPSAAALNQPEMQIDLQLLLEGTITAWSYEGVDLNKANIADLDNRTAQWAFREAVRLNVLDGETKNDS